MPKTYNDLPSCIQARNDLPFLVKNLCGGSNMQTTVGECHPADILVLPAPITNTCVFITLVSILYFGYLPADPV